MKRVNRKMKKGISKANMKMDKTIKRSKGALYRSSCVKEPGTKICKRDAAGKRIYKPGRTPMRHMFSSRRSRLKKKLRNDPLKVAARRQEKTELRKEKQQAKKILSNSMDTTGKFKKYGYKTMKYAGRIGTLGTSYAASVLASKARRGLTGKHKQTEQIEKLRQKTERYKERAKTALERKTLKKIIKDSDAKAKKEYYNSKGPRRKMSINTYRGTKKAVKYTGRVGTAGLSYLGSKLASKAYRKLIKKKTYMQDLREKAAYVLVMHVKQ